MVGSTPQLATAVWVGTADNTSAIFNSYGGIMYGSDAPTRIWKQILDTSLVNSEYQSFPTAYPIRYGSGNWGSGYTGSYGSSTEYGNRYGNNDDAPEETANPESPAPGEQPAPSPHQPAAPPAAPAQPEAPAPDVPSLEDIINGQGDLAELLRP